MTSPIPLEPQLTVVVTTYNRFDSLASLLNSLFCQVECNSVKIIVADNCSDYNLEAALLQRLGPSKMESVEINTKKFNIGALGNISNSFLLPNSKWMWLLSDDDITVPGSIARVLSQIRSFPDALGFKFTDIGLDISPVYDRISVDSLPDLLNVVSSCKIDLGNFIFMSNNIFNLDELRPYLIYAFTHSYTYVPHIIPLLMGVNDSRELIFFSDSIVKYQPPKILPNHDYFVSIYLGAMSIADLPIKLGKSDFYRFVHYFKMNSFWILSKNFYYSSLGQRRYLYARIYSAVFKNNSSLALRSTFALFILQHVLGTDVFSKTIENIKSFARGVRSLMASR